MRLNRKGYMLVEIVLASVLAMSIVYYLLNLTYKFKNTSEDIYQSIYYENDRMLITKNIMSDLERGVVTEVQESEDGQTIEFTLYIQNIGTEKRRILITEVNNQATIQYGKIEVTEGETYDFVKTDVSYYEKSLEPSLVVDSLELVKSLNGVATNGLAITIPIKSLYDDKDYSIKIFASKMVHLDLGFYVDYVWYNEGYPGSGTYNLKVGLKVNGEYIDGEEYKGDLCGYYPVNSIVEITGISINGTITTYSSEFTLEKDTNIWMKFDTTSGSLQFNGYTFNDYKTTDGTCLQYFFIFN